MRRVYDDEDERPNRVWRLVKGIFAGAVVSGVAVAVISIYVLPPPAPPTPAPEAEQADAGEPKVVDGIEVADRPAYFGLAEQDEPADAGEAGRAESAAAPDGPIELEGPALVVNAADFEAVPEMPLVAVVIDDAGANPMLHDSLFALDMPLTIGVLSGGPGDDVTAESARAAGYEVVAQLPLAAGGEAQGAALEYNIPAEEAAERTGLLMRRLPMAVAAARPLATPVPLDGRTLEGVMQALGPLGFAWLEHGVAPDAPAALPESGLDAIFAVSRFSIPPGTAAAEAHAILDRAAARAAQSGAAVVMAPAEEPVLMALQLWAGAAKAEMAPLSAVIRRQNGADRALADDSNAQPFDAVLRRSMDGLADYSLDLQDGGDPVPQPQAIEEPPVKPETGSQTN